MGLDILWKQLPTIILYLAAGYLYLLLFNFVSTNKNPTEFEHMFFKSLIIGFVLKNIVCIIPIRTGNYYLNIAGFLAICIFVAYSFGKIYISDSFRSILKVFGVSRTIHPYIWNDIEDQHKSLWVKVTFKVQNEQYLGILTTTEDFQRMPLIVLTRYTKSNLSGEIIADYTNDKTRRIVLDSSKADTVELIYDKDSVNIKGDKVIIK